MLVPGTPAPELTVPVLNGPRWTLHQEPARYGLVAFFRGGFCKYCRAFLGSLEAHLQDFGNRAVDVIAVSTDTELQAKQLLMHVSLPNLRIGFGLTVSDARRWQLYLTERRGNDGSSFIHAEPALHFVTPERRIYAVLQQSLSCGRPDLPSLIEGFDAMRSNQYPLRGNI
jgi:alkyl hydroperoxide reductase subunit AhpC